MQERRFDVVVAGCAAAGLSAAVAAAVAGARVAVPGRAPCEERGGRSRCTEAHPRMRSEAGVTDGFETHLAADSRGRVVPDLIEESARPRPGRALCQCAADRGARLHGRGKDGAAVRGQPRRPRRQAACRDAGAGRRRADGEFPGSDARQAKNGRKQS